MVTIVFETHATSEDNEAKLASGWADVPLSPTGERQARELGERYNQRAFDAIYCSDLQRSYRTAELAFGDAYPVVRDRRLRECNYGELNRAPVSEVEALRVSAIATPFPDGESYEDSSRRLLALLGELAATRAGQTVMIIGHRATQYGLDRWIRGVSLQEAIRTPWRWQPGWTYELA
ncbi:MAG: histidine phosphatase family protein [Deltaproteobacteria bacterium]|nr:histidine phosphatase family protein [Deltaproteobacteria bacterium]MDQ3301606.1 histidine phosphatase family protein [Myxococcota bacterium]